MEAFSVVPDWNQDGKSQSGSDQSWNSGLLQDHRLLPESHPVSWHVSSRSSSCALIHRLSENGRAYLFQAVQKGRLLWKVHQSSEATKDPSHLWANSLTDVPRMFPVVMYHSQWVRFISFMNSVPFQRREPYQYIHRVTGVLGLGWEVSWV